MSCLETQYKLGLCAHTVKGMLPEDLQETKGVKQDTEAGDKQGCSFKTTSYPHSLNLVLGVMKHQLHCVFV